jgi:hypothetical protein
VYEIKFFIANGASKPKDRSEANESGSGTEVQSLFQTTGDFYFPIIFHFSAPNCCRLAAVHEAPFTVMPRSP